MSGSASLVIGPCAPHMAPESMATEAIWAIIKYLLEERRCGRHGKLGFGWYLCLSGGRWRQTFTGRLWVVERNTSGRAGHSRFSVCCRSTLWSSTVKKWHLHRFCRHGARASTGSDGLWHLAGLGGCRLQHLAGLGGCRLQHLAGLGGCRLQHLAGLGGCRLLHLAGLGGCRLLHLVGLGDCRLLHLAGLGGCRLLPLAGLGGCFYDSSLFTSSNGRHWMTMSFGHRRATAIKPKI